MKNLLVYSGKYGATRQYAEWLSEMLQLPAADADGCSLANLDEGGLVIMGSSVYIGKLQLTGWLRQNEMQLKKYQLFLFVVSGTSLNETDKLQDYVKNSMPSSLLEKCRIFFLPGRLVYKRLSRRDRFMLRLGALFAGKKAAARMLTDYDLVKKDYLHDLINELDPVLNADQCTGNSAAISHNQPDR